MLRTLRIDQTLTQDATGTMAYLQFEAMGIPLLRGRGIDAIDRAQSPPVLVINETMAKQLLFIGTVLILGQLLRPAAGRFRHLAPRVAAYVIGSVAALWVFERSLAVI